MNICSVRVPSLLVWRRHFCPIAVLCCSAVLNTEWLHIHSSIKHSLTNSTNTTSGCGAVPDTTRSYSSERGITSSVTIFSPFLKRLRTQKLKIHEMCMKMMNSCNLNFIFILESYILCFFCFVFLIKKMCTFVQLWNIHFHFVNLCRRGNGHFDVHFLRIMSVHLLSKDWMDASYEGRDEGKSCLFPARVGISIFLMYLWWKYFSLFVPWLGV